MNFADYYALALRTAKPLPSDFKDLQHAALGFITEIGEFVSEVKRIEIYGREMTEEMRLHMIEELGDFCWYIPLMLRARGVGNHLPTLTDVDMAEVNGLVSIASIAMMLWGSATVVIPTIEGLDDIPLPDVDEVSHVAALMIVLIDRLAVLLGTTGDQVRAENIAKLQKRYPDAYSDQAAEARADKGGMDHQNS